MKNVITINYFNDEEDVLYNVPAVNEVCSKCEGYGTLEHNMQQWMELDASERQLLTEHHITCNKCYGNNVTLVPDFMSMSLEEIEATLNWQDIL